MTEREIRERLEQGMTEIDDFLYLLARVEELEAALRITEADVRKALTEIRHDKVDSELEGDLWIAVFVSALNARALAEKEKEDG